MTRIPHPEFIIVSGSGKKVGKTRLVKALIRTFSARFPLLALKISPHVHDSSGESQLAAEAEGIRIFRDMAPHRKNSGQFLAAGARASYFMETTDEKIEGAFALFMNTCNTERLPVICESGALGSLVKPGVLVFITYQEAELHGYKTDIIYHADLVLPARTFQVAEIISRVEFIPSAGFAYQLVS